MHTVECIPGNGTSPDKYRVIFSSSNFIHTIAETTSPEDAWQLCSHLNGGLAPVVQTVLEDFCMIWNDDKKYLIDQIVKGIAEAKANGR